MIGGAIAAVVAASLLTVLPRSGNTLLAQQPPSGIAGTYVGRYTCGRELGMHLTLEQPAAGRVSGVFTFFSYGGTAANPLGAFRVAGTFDSQTRALRLQPGDWIRKPSQWTAEGLSGTVSSDGTSVKGTIESTICTSFEIFREGALPERERIAQEAAAARARGFDPARLRAIEERIQRDLERAAAPRPASPVAAVAPQPPKSSAITKLFEAELGPAKAPSGMPPLDTTGFRRGDMLGPIYDGRFELATAAGLDNIRYFIQSVGDLSSRCKNLDMESAKFQVLPYVIAGAKDAWQRILALKASDSEYFQAAWLLMLQMNANWKCEYNPRGVVTREQAQASCDAAGAASSSFGVLPSLDAATDITLFVGRYGCQSRETRHLARQLVEFARLAHTRMQFTAAMPSPTSPEGKAYARMFENCSRRRSDNQADDWCACYVRTLHSLKPPAGLLEDLSNNPFVDAGTYLQWMAANVPGAGALYKCSDRHSPIGRAMAPRPTACLVDQRSQNDGTNACTYRAAWGEFTTAETNCQGQIDSRIWGYREVDCAAGGRSVVASGGPRIWNEGRDQFIDYEQPVPDTLVPDLPADARSKRSVIVRFLKRETPGALRTMHLKGVSPGMFNVYDDRTLNLMAPDENAVNAENARVLACQYNAAKGTVWTHLYWFEKVPAHVSDGRLNKALSPHPFSIIKGAASRCPARRPPG
jgi:hypothetical protein